MALTISNNKITLSNLFQRILKYTGSHLVLAAMGLLVSLSATAQETKAGARMDAASITVGDQARLFIDVQHDPATGTLQWATIPDTFNHLEVVEKGKIDTLKQGYILTYRQRLLITGFDSGAFKVPPFVFVVVPTSGDPYAVQTDSFMLAVQTVKVDTTQAFKPIKGIMEADTSWKDYIWYIIAGILLVIATIVGVVYFMRRKKVPPPPKPTGPVETLTERTLRLLNELEAKQVWQKGQVKEYYVQLTDIVRNYIEERFSTPAMELTTDELLYKVQYHRELMPYHGLLSGILYTADLAKFAKAEPTPQEHVDAMDKAKQLVNLSKPVVTVQSNPVTETPKEKQ
jgi:hypothetical protein